jgi:hypothetical protein
VDATLGEGESGCVNLQIEMPILLWLKYVDPANCLYRRREVDLISARRAGILPVISLMLAKTSLMERLSMLDFTAVRLGSQTFTDVAANLTKTELYQLTDEMIDTMQEIVANAVDADVVFVPEDPGANDTYGRPEDIRLSWTLGHVIVHATASAEESAALALTLARGIPVEGRSRYEVPWESVISIAQARQRLEESRRIRKTMLDAWPDEPHIDVTYTPFPQAGALNAVGRFILGLSHDANHLGQLREIMRQGRELHPRS